MGDDYRGTVWGRVRMYGRVRPAYVSAAGAFVAPMVAAPWREMTAEERERFVPDWGWTRMCAHGDAAREGLRRARDAGAGGGRDGERAGSATG